MTDSKRKAHLLLVVGTHGNERTGPWLMQRWQASPDTLGSPLPVSLCLGNPEAFALNRRYVDQDLNRSFIPELFGNTDHTAYELTRARELLNQFGPRGHHPHQLVLDLHTTTAAMGSCLAVSGERPADLALAALVQQRLGLPIYLSANNPAQPGLMIGQWPCGLLLEVGPIAQGIIDPAIALRMEAGVKGILATLKACLAQEAQLPKTLVVHRHFANLDWPRNQAGRQTGCLHQDRLGTDWCKLRPGEPLFLSESGATLPYEGAEPIWPIFINEAAYQEKGIALVATRKESLQTAPHWLQALNQAVGI